MLFLNVFDSTLEGADHDVDVRRVDHRIGSHLIVAFYIVFVEGKDHKHLSGILYCSDYLLQCFLYRRSFNPQDALNQYNRIADAILSLDEYPARYPLFECEPEHYQGIHRMIVNNYVMCYVMDSDKVTITDILYGASDIHSKLENRHLSNDR